VPPTRLGLYVIRRQQDGHTAAIRIRSSINTIHMPACLPASEIVLSYYPFLIENCLMFPSTDATKMHEFCISSEAEIKETTWKNQVRPSLYYSGPARELIKKHDQKVWLPARLFFICLRRQVIPSGPRALVIWSVQ
jgi:hypothetical protein